MKREFAPGIPAGRVIKSIPKVSPKADNQEWDVSLSSHPAAVRGLHQDLRLVDPQGKAHSWALSKMPEPGQSTYAAQQATHSKSYALRSKPWKIPPGYGATAPGRMVEPIYVQKAEVVEASNNKIRFLRHHGQETDEFVLRKVREENGKPLWAINNATKNRYTREGQKLPSSKPKYKEIKPEQVDFSDVGEVMTPKLDGSHVLVDFKGPKAPIRVYSYRPTERKTGVIEHTFKFPDFQNRTTSPLTKNTLIRAELWGSKDGKAIPAEQLGGILNSGVLKSRDKQREGNIQLRLTGIDVVKHRGKSYENKDFGEKLKALRSITKGSKGMIEMPLVARTSEEKEKLLDDVKSGRFPETKEGVVLHRTDSSAPPTKVKFKPQDDVYVREIFTKERGKARGHAGGFGYSLTPDGPIVGRVGTGFNHSMRKDMMDNPEKYVGRVAKVQSQGPYRSGALRSPSFDEWHIDKTPPELMKEGQTVEKLQGEEIRQFRRKYKDSPPISSYHDDVYGLKHEKDIVGGVIVRGRVGEYAGKVAKKKGHKPKHTLSYFYVDEPYRGKGHGDKILSTALRGRGTTILGTDNSGRYSNEAAKHLYRKHGFEPIKKERRSTFWVKDEPMNKTSQEDILKAVKEYKEQAVEEATPDRAVEIARLAFRPSRGPTAANIGLRLAKEHIDEDYPGRVDKHIRKARREAKSRIGSAAGFIKDWRE